MIVFDLQCANGHVFEGWFQDNSAYEDQVEQAMVECPVCNDRHVEKILTPFAIKIAPSESRAAGFACGSFRLASLLRVGYVAKRQAGSGFCSRRGRGRSGSRRGRGGSGSRIEQIVQVDFFARESVVLTFPCWRAKLHGFRYSVERDGARSRAMDHFVYRDGELYCEDVPVARIADAVGTPTYVYSAATFRDCPGSATRS